MADVKIPPELESLIDESLRQFADIIRRVAKASMRHGAEIAKEAVNEVLQDYFAGKLKLEAAERGLEAAKADARKAGVIPPGEYGAVAQGIKVALNHFRSKSDGVTVPDIHRYINRDLGNTDVTEQQIRNSLKGMLKAGTADSPSRGRYGAGPKLPATREAA